MRVVFFGSDDFAEVCLERLFKSRHCVVACMTQPDTHQGRGMKLHFSPIKILAAEHAIACFQPDSLKHALVVEQLKELNADIFVVVAYGQILTKAILEIPKFFCVNVHGSLLPKYRGAAPVNWAVLNGETQTGVTVQKMVLGLDAGDIIAQTKMSIPSDMSADLLRRNMADKGAELLVKVLDQIEGGQHTLTPQDPTAVTHAPKLFKEMGRIQWQNPATVIYNQIRGLKPWPGTFSTFRGKMVKVLSADVAVGSAGPKPGTITAVDKQGICVACQEGALLIKEVLPEAGKAMSAAGFAAGYKAAVGDFFET